MDYLLQITDETRRTVILEGARVNPVGLEAILENMTSLSQMGREHFIFTLLSLGVCTYISDEDDELRYNISAMKL